MIYGDGTATRDFLYVDDLCDGIAAAADAPLADEIFHLASGTETTIEGLARAVLDLTDSRDAPIRYEDRRGGEVERNFSRIDRASRLVAFEPTHSLRDGLRKTIDWYVEHETEREDAVARGR